MAKSKLSLADATFEDRLAGGVHLWSIEDLMPQNGHRRSTERPNNFVSPKFGFLHHSGSLGASGVQGAVNSANYVVRERNFPGGQGPYHIWIPYEKLKDATGAYVALRMSADKQRTWSQGDDANDWGWSICLQGNLTKKTISPSQIEVLEALLPWAMDRFGWSGSDLLMHKEASSVGGRSKSTCPGTSAEAYLREYRARM